MTLLATKGLTKRFGGLVAVNNVDFSVPEGQIRGLIGPNGAGKSTLVGMLCGRISSTSGEISFNGKDVTHLPAHRRTASACMKTSRWRCADRVISMMGRSMPR
jgi:branched-chain amino acid transport system ATP-binding protein